MEKPENPMNEGQEERKNQFVLVIDDDEAQLKTLSDILESEELDPICCNNGKRALKACKQYEMNVAILDLQLPDIDGLELLKQLKQCNPDIKVIVNTAHASLESAMTAINEEAFAYVKKMGNIEELLAHVHRAFHAHLAIYSDKLEREVNKQTAELALANKKLTLEITERVHAGAALQQSERELIIRNQIADIFLTTPDEKIFEKVLKVILDSLQSKYGIFGYIDEQETLVMPSISRDIWKQCQIADKTFEFPRDTWSGIWGRALIEKKSLHSNKKMSVPKGHISIKRVLVVPIIFLGDVIGLLQVANKMTDYDERDIKLMETIAKHIAPILSARLQLEREARENRQAEEALRDSEEQLRSITISAKDAIISANSHGKICFWNLAAEEIFGFSEDEAMDKNFLKLIFPEHFALANTEGFEKFGQPVEYPFAGSTFELMSKRKNGETFPIELSLSAFKIKEKWHSLAMIRDITERYYAEQNLKKSREQSRKLATHLQSVSEKERLKIAREIHDELGQSLAALKMDLALLSRDLSDKNEKIDSESILAEITSMINLVNNTIKQVRKIITELRPEILDSIGLIAALEWYSKDFQERFGIGCVFASNVDELNLTKEYSIAIYRIFQETLTNITRHAKATKINVKCEKTGNEKLLLEVSDNGIGITNENIDASDSFGILGMKERATILSGEVKIWGKTGEGTTVQVVIPLKINK